MLQETVNQGMTPHAGDGCAAGSGQAPLSEYTLLKMYAKATNIPVECLKFEKTGVPDTATIVIPVVSLPDDYFTVNSISVCHGYARDMFTYKQLASALEDRQRLTDLSVYAAKHSDQFVKMPNDKHNQLSKFLNDLADCTRRCLSIHVQTFCGRHDLSTDAFAAVDELDGVKYDVQTDGHVSLRSSTNTGLISTEKLLDRMQDIQRRKAKDAEDNGPMLHGCCVTKHPGITNPPAKYRVPFQETDDELQKAIMDAIRTWDIGVPEWYEGHTGAMGNHACAIADAVRAILPMWMRRSVK